MSAKSQFFWGHEKQWTQKLPKLVALLRHRVWVSVCKSAVSKDGYMDFGTDFSVFPERAFFGEAIYLRLSDLKIEANEGKLKDVLATYLL